MSGRGRGKGPSRAQVAPEDGNPPPIGRIKRVADQGPPKVGTLPQPRGKGRSKGRGRGPNDRGGRGGRGGGTPNRGRGGAANSRSGSPRGRNDRDRASSSEFGRSRGRPRGGFTEGSSRSRGTSPVPYYGARSPSPRREWERRQESYRFDDRRHKAYSPSMPVDPAGPSSSSRSDFRQPPRRSPSPPRDQNHTRWASSPVPVPVPPPVAVRPPPPPPRREVSPDRKPVVMVQPQAAPSTAAPPGPPQPPKFRPRNHNQRQNLPVVQNTVRPVRPPANAPQPSGLLPAKPAVPLPPNPAPLAPPPSAPGWRTLPTQQPDEPSTRRSRSRNISSSRSPKQSHANLTEDIDIDIKPDIAALEKEQEERLISSSPPPRGPQTEGVAYFLRGEIPSQCFLPDKNARKVARDKFAQRQRAQLALEGKVAVPGGAKWRDDGFALDWRLSSPDDDVQIMPSLLSAPMGTSSTVPSKKKKVPAVANQGQAGPSEASTKKRSKSKTPKVTPTPPPQGGPLPYPAEAESGTHTREFPPNFDTPQSRQTDEFRRWRQAIVDSYRIRPDGSPNIVEAKVTLNGLNISWRPALANEESPLDAQAAPPDTVRASSGPGSASGPSTRSASPGKRPRDDSPATSEPARKRKALAQSEPPPRAPRAPRAPRPPVRPSRVRSPEVIDLSGPVAASAPGPAAHDAPFMNLSAPQILSEDTPSTSCRVLSTPPPPASTSYHILSTSSPPGSSSSATSTSPRRGFAQAPPLPTPISPNLGSGSQAPQLPSSDPPAPVLVGAERLADMQRRMGSLFDRIDRWTRLVQDFPQREPSLRKQIERTEDAIFNLQNEIDAEKEKLGM